MKTNMRITTVTILALLASISVGGWATLTGHYNAGLSFNIDQNNWGCATSRAFREVACHVSSALGFTAPVFHHKNWVPTSQTHNPSPEIMTP